MKYATLLLSYDILTCSNAYFFFFCVEQIVGSSRAVVAVYSVTRRHILEGINIHYYEYISITLPLVSLSLKSLVIKPHPIPGQGTPVCFRLYGKFTALIA